MYCVKDTNVVLLVLVTVLVGKLGAEQEPKVYFYIKDHLGSTRMVIDREKAAQALSAPDFDPNQRGIAEVSSYYPFGKEMPGKGGMVTSKTTTEKFTGKELDSDGQIDWDTDGKDDPGEQGLDLSYFGARYYDAEIGRWIAVDPAVQFFDAYSYSSNDPINYYDPNGLWTPEQRAAAIQTAEKYRNSKSTYEYGAKGGPGQPVDCSGVAKNCYPGLPPIIGYDKGTDAYYNRLSPRSGTPKVGDLVFFSWDENRSHAHMGIVTSIDNGVITYTHARQKSNAVVSNVITDYYYKNFKPEFRYDPVGEDSGPWRDGYVFPNKSD